MIKINLLSPADKLNIKLEKTYCLIKNNLAVLISIQVFFVVIFLAAAIYLNSENKNLDKQLEYMELGQETKEISAIEKELARQNNQLKAFSQIQKNQYYWTKIFENLNKTVFSGIRISSISIEPEISEAVVDKKTKGAVPEKTEAGNFKLTIIGVSKTMEDLLIFENYLKNSEIFSGFSIDPKNYDDENFKYILSIKKENIVLEY
jgi:Tfp pilus assembly protein PilN